MTQPGFVMKVEGEGMPVHKFPSDKGDLYVEFTVVLPVSLSDSQKASVKSIFS